MPGDGEMRIRVSAELREARREFRELRYELIGLLGDLETVTGQTFAWKEQLDAGLGVVTHAIGLLHTASRAYQFLTSAQLANALASAFQRICENPYATGLIVGAIGTGAAALGIYGIQTGVIELPSLNAAQNKGLYQLSQELPR